jgi:type I restriction enzyme S subunit
VFRAFLRTGRFQRIAKWTTSMAHRGANRFAEMLFPLASEAAQVRIVERSERDLTLLANLKLEVLRAEKRSAALRQAILAKAFSGNLVPQDPNDEPASNLLERIRAERVRRPHS